MTTDQVDQGDSPTTTSINTTVAENDPLERDGLLNDETRDQIKSETTTFKELGTRPSKIQVEAIPVALAGRDVIGLAKTGSGKTSAFYLVLDEADRILNLDFEQELDTILKEIPRKGRRTLLFSATMTSKVAKLQRTSMRDPLRVEVSSKYRTLDNLQHFYFFVPDKHKDLYLVHLLNQTQGNNFIIFCNTCANTQRIALMLRNLGFNAIPLHGQMSQAKRLDSQNKFKTKARSVLLATDVASRGLDIPHVDIVVDYDIPTHLKSYIHRVGRTAHAGRHGKAMTLVSQYDVELYQRIEHLIGKKLPLYETVDSEVMLLNERVLQAQRVAKTEMADAAGGGGGGAGKRKRYDDDDEEQQEEEGGTGPRKLTARRGGRGRGVPKRMGGHFHSGQKKGASFSGKRSGGRGGKGGRR
ncbi:putative ATP-dependent RNA helicase ddx47 [Tyrophagus putrescentiae]|nr:putative ATP-dependent RNA helicase ddx47 [Tyrophagus putrescentiae]